MSDIQIQFHALRSEIAEILGPSLTENRLHLLGVIFRPFTVDKLNEVNDGLLDDRYDRYVITLRPPTTKVDGVNGLLDANPNAIILDVGRQSDDWLRESCLSIRSSNDEAVAAARQLAGKLRKATKAGALATNPVTGATAWLRNHRYSAGAARLEDDGAKMLPVAGNATLSFKDQA